MSTANKEQQLLAKIRTLPPEKIIEVEDFVEFLRSKNADAQLVKDAATLSETALAKVWDNEDDADYDRI